VSVLANKEISLVLGTAGHIDHGKTTLVKAITGVDCDRLSEEKKRGITIELGFAPLAMEDGRVVSIVDVPGHERFIRQMVAGASGIDAVMLVVAADEGIMPQTREHLEILKLLGVKDGIVVVTKSDMVDDEFLELVIEDMRDFLHGTFLERKAIVPVSSYTGKNIPMLREELAKLVDRIRPRPRKGPYFLPIDRVFPVSGFGAVVTGTAYRGEISSGQEGTVLPAGKECRIRSVQVHGTGVQTAWAGQRVAVNVAGISSEDLSRGDVLCARGVYARTRCFECELHLVENASEPVQHWQRVRLHIGTSDVVARISLLESPLLQPGETAAAQVVAEEDIVCLVDQRFVLRRYSPLETIAGGRVLFPYAAKPRGKSARQACIQRIRALSSLSSPEERLLALIRSFSRIELPDAALFIQETPAETLRFGERLQKNGDAVFLQGEKKLFLSRERFSSETRAVEEFLSSYHSSHPSRKGAPSDQIALQALKDLDPRASRAFLEALSENGTVVMDEGTVRMADFTPRDDKAFEKNSEAILDFCRKRDFQPPLLSEAMDAAGLDEKAFSLLIKGMREAGLVSIVSDEFLFSSEIEEKLLKILLQEKDDITIAKVRDITGSSRKFILPLLEYLDARGYTRRAGDRRVLLASKLPASIRAQSQ